MSKKLAAKASQIQLPPVAAPAAVPSAPLVAATVPPAESGEPRAKTAPGSMALFMASQSAAVKEADELRARLKAFDGALPVRRLDPQAVRPSRWANRHADSYRDAAFEELKADIAAAGSNVQPVSVRPLPAAAGGGGGQYELIFGHRRHRACLELGLPVQALVVELSDLELFEAMERENRARKNLSAWEQGRMYRRALDDGLYPSQRRLAESLGVDVSLVSKSLSLARLPDAVVAAFPSPLEIQFRWAQPLAEALQKDPDGVLARAAAIKKGGAAMSAAAVLAALASPEPVGLLNRSTVAERVIQGRAGRRATISRDARGQLLVRFSAGALDDAAEAELAELVRRLVDAA